ncbi:MAG: hypothetical protein PHN99_04195 [Eubacteriales bacterium]|nr:hypothetical protein [Eubacteriales bacterium]MDD4717294.1 hypothetical protein [Eubacteriales bacterium]
MNKIRETLGSIRLDDETKGRIIAGITAVQEKDTLSARRRPRTAVVAAAVILIVASISGIAVYAEKAEYDKAVRFFDEYKLNSEGLTRNDIKIVYKDISTGRFSYDKTMDVIVNSVGGKELFQEEPDREDIEALWNYRNEIHIFVPKEARPDQDGVSFEYEYIENKLPPESRASGMEFCWDTSFRKLKDGKEVWKVQLRDFNYNGHVKAGEDTIIFGTNTLYDSNTRMLARVVMIGNDGKEKWVFGSPGESRREEYRRGFWDEGGVTLFGVSEFDKLICTRLDPAGELISHRSSGQPVRFYIETAARLGDGYLVLTRNYDQGDTVLKTDGSGVPVDSYVYDSENEFYTIRDMAEFGGRVFLSAYAVPKTDIEGGYGGRHEIADILKYIFDEKAMEIENEELTKLLRDNYTAMLMLCDPVTGAPKEFYSVKGSLGADLKVDGDPAQPDLLKLVWDVESITEAYFSPATSSFTIGAGCHIYRYTFGIDGGLESQTETGEVAGFMR